MKPDGVATAAMEPMDTGAEPATEAPPTGEEPGQDPPPSQPGEAEPSPQETAPPAAKAGDGGKPGELKAKAKVPAKTKPGAAGAKTTGPAARTGTGPNRSANGVQKTLTNGVTKKPSAPAPAKKTTTPTAPPKRPMTTTTPSKMADRKPTGAARPASSPVATNGARAATGASPANKRTPVGPGGDAKTKPKSTGPRPASATASRPGATAAPKPDRPPVSKTTRPSTAPSPATRPASASTATKTATSARAPASRPGATAPSAGRSPAAQPPKASTPAKKDVSKPTTPAAKKPAATPTRPSPAKPTPKSTTPAKPDSAPKRPAVGAKAADAKAGRKPEVKATAVREVNASPRASGTRPGAGKPATPTSKKAVGSSTPMPVKRAPKVAELGAAPPQGLMGFLAGAGAAISAAATAMCATEPPVKTAESPAAPDAPPPITDVPAATPATPTGLLDDVADVPTAPPPVDDAPLVDPTAVSEPILGTTVLSPPSSPPGPTLAPPLSPPPCLLDRPMPDLPSPGAAPQILAESAVKQPWDDEEHKPPSPPAGGADDDEPVKQEAETGVEPRVATPTDDLARAVLQSLSLEREEAVEKADEEINEDDEDEEEEEEEREGSQPVSLSEMSGTQPTDESRAGSAGVAGSVWRAGALMSELDSEDVSGSQQGASELSAPGLLEGTESTDDLADTSLKGAEGDGASASSPDIETVPEIPANEDEDEEDEEEEEEEDRVYDMDVSSERAEDPRQSRREEEEAEEEEEEDEDVEMASEGVTESGLESYGNADEDDFAEEDRLDNLNRTPAAPPVPPAGPWAQSAGPYADPWAPPPELSPAHPISPLPDRWAVNPGIPTPPSQAWLDLGSAPLLPPLADEPLPHAAAAPQPTPPAQSPPPLPPPAVGMSQSSTLSGRDLAARSSSETSTPEELRDYDSSSGVESRSEDKHDTPVPQAPPDAEQDLGIHLERGDGEEEEEAEAETLPADEVLGGPPTAPASATPSPSDSGEEAESDTEGEMQINEAGGAAAGRGLSALEEREEAGDPPAGEEEDGGTPQSANSAASYVFDITSTSNNSNAHSAAESCGRSPGIFSLENEDQLPEEAKDPSLIKELTLPAAAPAVDLLPLDDQPGDRGHDDDDDLAFRAKHGGLEPLDAAQCEPGHQEAPEVQPPYYSTICDKTDNFLAGNV